MAARIVRKYLKTVVIYGRFSSLMNTKRGRSLGDMTVDAIFRRED